MTVTGSYANGFAPRDGQPLYPELWNGCAGAWSPSLGPTGLILRDWSHRKNNADITGMVTQGPAWGNQSVTLDGSTGYLKTSHAESADVANAYSVSMWVRLQRVISYEVLAELGAGGSSDIQMYFNNSGVLVLLHNRGNGGSISFENSWASPQIGTWSHVAVVWKSRRWAFYVNGKMQNQSSTDKENPATTANRKWFFGFSENTGSYGGNAALLGSIADVRIYSRAITALEVKTLSTRPGIAYELAQRRRSRIFTGGFKAYLVTRKTQIIGGGM